MSNDELWNASDNLKKKIHNYDLKTRELGGIVEIKAKELKNKGKKIINQSVEEFMKKKRIDLIFEPMFRPRNYNYYLENSLLNTLKEKLNIKEASEDNPENN